MTCLTTSPDCLSPYKRGDTWRIPFAWRQYRNGPSIDLTDCTAAMQIRNKRTGELVAEADEFVFEPRDDEDFPSIVVAVFNNTQDVEPGTHLTDLEVTFADGTKQSSATFSLPVIADQTRPNDG